MKPRTCILICILVLIAILLLAGYAVIKMNNKRTLSVGTVNNALSKSKIYNVDITPLGFLPPELEIKIGDSVTWKNRDANTYQLVFSSSNVTKPVKLLKNENFTYFFNKEGVYNYSDIEYSYKKGKIIVKA